MIRIAADHIDQASAQQGTERASLKPRINARPDRGWLTAPATRRSQKEKKKHFVSPKPHPCSRIGMELGGARRKPHQITRLPMRRRPIGLEPHLAEILSTCRHSPELCDEVVKSSEEIPHRPCARRWRPCRRGRLVRKRPDALPE